MDKNLKITTYVNIGLRETDTKRILSFLYNSQKPVTLKEIEEDTGLTNLKIRGLLSYLGKMNKVTKKYKIGPAKRGQPPRKIVFVSLEGSQNDNAKKVLDKHKRLKEFFEGKNGL